MNREDCYMSFSEALEQYLQAREKKIHGYAGWKDAPEEMRIAAEYMDALTQPQEAAKLADAERRGVEWACKRFAYHDGSTYADMVLEEYKMKENS